MTQNNRHPDSYVNGHGFKGIIGKRRAERDKPSSYGDGDRGGSAGAMMHGLGGGPALAPNMMGSHGYGGEPICFEGGVRGGGVSEHETMPAQYPFPRKVGYDEHRSRSGVMEMEGTIHGLPGVEGIKPVIGLRPSGHGAADDTMPSSTETKMSDGYGCPHGCGFMKSRHGLARHLHAKHGYGALGHALTGHGSSYKEGEEFRGETEGPREMERIRDEYGSAKPIRRSSSYLGGDAG